jgi:hypothetical protein
MKSTTTQTMKSTTTATTARPSPTAPARPSPTASATRPTASATRPTAPATRHYHPQQHQPQPLQLLCVAPLRSGGLPDMVTYLVNHWWKRDQKVKEMEGGGLRDKAEALPTALGEPCEYPVGRVAKERWSGGCRA